LAFGPDGYLYISTGDGGPDPLPFSDPDAFPGDPQNRSQSLSNTYGSILRLDVDNPNGFWQEDCQFSGGDNPDAYSIPVDNPHVNGPGGPCDEVWANGLRNPWRFSFDRLTGDMYIADVGEWIHEEVNFVPAGAPGGRNFGWHCFEGTTDYTTVWPQVAGDCGAPPYTPPVAEYMHQQGACSITGGFVYRGSEQPGLFGWYVFADFCNGHFWRMNATNGWQPVELAFTGDFISTFGEDANGELFVGTWVPPFGNGGSIYRVVVP
jgi:glucose/arabinose dehydrogenase